MEANKVLADISIDRSLWLRQLREEMIEGDRIAHEQGLQRKFEEQHKALVEESRAEGLAEGKAEEKDSIIYEMLKDGSFDVNVISKICKVDISYVEQLKKQLKK